jgi:group I intron endonuclease
VNGKKYVGQTVQTLKKRWKEHVYDSTKSSTTNFHNAIRKYGDKAFKLETIVWCSSKEDMDNKERHYISHLNTMRPCGYNLTIGGDGSFGYKHSEEALRKIGEHTKTIPNGMLGKKHSRATKKLISDKAKLRPKRAPMSDESKVKLSKSKTGVKRKSFSKEWKTNLSKAQTLRWKKWRKERLMPSYKVGKN